MIIILQAITAMYILIYYILNKILSNIIRVSRNGVLTTGPQKVFPLSWISAEYPYLLAELKSIEEVRFFPLHAQPSLYDENKLFIESSIDVLAIGKPWEE